MFAVVGDEAVARSTAFASLKKHHAALVAGLASGNAGAASEALRACQSNALPGLDRLWLAYASQIKDSAAKS